MLSFRTEIENPLVQKDIIDLEKKIHSYRLGTVDEEKFRSLRLARGIYGQRQPGVQMVRIKLPFGRLTPDQLTRICDVSDEYSTGNLHLTTRQDIQIHFVSLDRTPQLWEELEKDQITIREACGNTVRNITASPEAGIDPDEPFDVSPYAFEAFRYFLRNPVCQELGRKFKIAFSSSSKDTAFAYIHDAGFIPQVKIYEGVAERGFKVVIGGGLGAQPNAAVTAFEFLPEDKVIPFLEGMLRVFDRFGERSNRNKARLKFLLNKIGAEAFLELVNEEILSLKVKSFKVNRYILPEPSIPSQKAPAVDLNHNLQYLLWLKTNVFEQKQKGYFAVQIKVQLGNITTAAAREFISLVREYVSDDIRITANQGFLIKYISKANLPYIYTKLNELGLASAGFDSTADITACPGTDTCNLGISNSTAVSVELENLLENEYPHLLENKDIKIKISGCMNSCGQHGLANIGFHGSSIKSGKNVIPALQLLLGGGTVGNGSGRFAERIIKIPSKKAPDVLRTILNDYEQNCSLNELFNEYYDRQTKNYFYNLLKPLADTSDLSPEDFVDWGSSAAFKTAIGIGECAGVVIDLTATLLFDAEEKTEWSTAAYLHEAYADSIYNSYSAFINTAKALLLTKNINCNTQNGILNDFENEFSEQFNFKYGFREWVLQLNKNEPGADFAAEYLQSAKEFITKAKSFHSSLKD